MYDFPTKLRIIVNVHGQFGEFKIFITDSEHQVSASGNSIGQALQEYFDAIQNQINHEQERLNAMRIAK